MEVSNWLDWLREMSLQIPDCRVVLWDEPPDLDNAGDYEPEDLAVLQVRVDRDAQQVTLHTESDEDGPFLVPVPMLLTDLVAELERSAGATFQMFWVSGLRRLPEEEFDEDQDGKGPYYARLAVPLIGAGYHDDLPYVIFMRARFPTKEESPGSASE